MPRGVMALNDKLLLYAWIILLLMINRKDWQSVLMKMVVQ